MNYANPKPPFTIKGFTFVDSFIDPTGSNAVRALFIADTSKKDVDPFYLVIKIFDLSDGTKFTVKFWRTPDIRRTADLWNTKSAPLTPATWEQILLAYRSFKTSMISVHQ